MTALPAAPTRTTDGGHLLRTALRIDATASGALGVLGVVAAPLLADLLGPPAPLLFGVGVFFVVFAAALLFLASRRTIPRAAARTVVLGNAAWVVGCVVATIVGAGALTGLGTGVVLAQAAAVAVFAGLQWTGLRRST